MADEGAFDADLRSLLERKAPFVSVYLNTHATTEQGGREIQLRWRGLRERATGSGASEAELAPLDDLVAGIQRSGWGLAAFLAEGELVVRKLLPTEIADGITYGPVPHLLPLLEWQQDNPRGAVVIADREGADIHVIGGADSEETVSVEGSQDWPIGKVRAGGAAHRRIQQAAQETWEANAREVSKELDRIARQRRIDFVAVTGDPRAKEMVEQHVSEDVRPLVFELSSAPATSIRDIADELTRDAAAFTAQTGKELLERFQAAGGQRDLAAEGAHSVLEALRRTQVDTLLLTTDLPERNAFFSESDLTQAALDEQALLNFGLQDTREARLDDVLVRGALGTGARVWILPALPSDEGPKDGVGAILRFQ
jgi:peptide subunit release factor 1 (eRF1)